MSSNQSTDDAQDRQANVQVLHYMHEMALFQKYSHGDLRKSNLDRRTGRDRRCHLEFVRLDHRSHSERRTHCDRRDQPPEKARRRRPRVAVERSTRAISPHGSTGSRRGVLSILKALSDRRG